MRMAVEQRTTENLRAELTRFIAHLGELDYAQNSMTGYRTSIKSLLDFLDGEGLTKDALSRYRQHLCERLKISSVNRHTSAINQFLRFLSLDEYTLKLLHDRNETAEYDELTHWEFLKLVMSAPMLCEDKIAMIILTLAGTGIQMSELRYITAEAVREGKAVISGKSKDRERILPDELRQQLAGYCRHANIETGPVFLGNKQMPISCAHVARGCKQLAEQAGINPEKVSPRSLRRYYDRCFLDHESKSALPEALGLTGANTVRIRLNRELALKMQSSDGRTVSCRCFPCYDRTRRTKRRFRETEQRESQRLSGRRCPACGGRARKYMRVNGRSAEDRQTGKEI